jgi:archaellum component FlaD/FlaE|tara:strand:- start:1330 stop:1566 length:237 start_codon:yes stop_codon:yes gene_type:complete
MTIINHYSIIHFIIYYFVGRYTGIRWLLFLLFSFGWELLELVLPYDFAIETISNKVADIIVNFIGYGVGLYFKGQENN